jgi:hypothetical protein
MFSQSPDVAGFVKPRIEAYSEVQIFYKYCCYDVSHVGADSLPSVLCQDQIVKYIICMNHCIHCIYIMFTEVAK